MPLKSGSSDKTISDNISELHGGTVYEHTAAKYGKKRANKQAIAIALSKAREGKAQGGPIGSIPGTPVGVALSTDYAAGGGVAGAGVNVPHTLMTKGSILSDVPGRTDSHATHVPSGSYVIPADIVSGRGQGNTLAGTKALERLFRLGRKPARKLNAPRPTRPRGLAFGGSLELPEEEASSASPVRVNLAGGEIVVPPENLTEVVHPDLKTAHEIMDAWVLQERKNLRKELAKLPGPAKD